ncbi:MAG: glycine/betaine/sarcosine/D-proline family reductase selenoprotein B, partial [Chloroflexi bacterium]|nr:glycine/betaine/sarcosine/D-proline family reductase selenoprotein B [Chloroflexota bacterium]
EQVLEFVSKYRPDLVVAGPAFNAGRYGLACGQVGAAVQERLHVPTVAGMYPENPGVELYRARVYIVPTGATAATMAAALERMAALGLKLARGERLGLPAEEGYLSRGLRFGTFVPRPAGARAVDMLLQRLRGQAFETEWPLPQYERVAPPPPIRDLSRATVALVTSAGIVPRGNPDRIESTFATRWLQYSLAGVADLSGQDWQSVHGGYDATYVNQDPDRVLPVDVLRDLETEGVIGRLLDRYYMTVGSGASTTSAKRFGQEIARELVAAGVDGVILTAT